MKGERDLKAKCDQCTIDTSRTSPFNKIPLKKLSRAEDNRQRKILQTTLRRCETYMERGNVLDIISATQI